MHCTHIPATFEDPTKPATAWLESKHQNCSSCTEKVSLFTHFIATLNREDGCAFHVITYSVRNALLNMRQIKRIVLCYI